MTSVRAVRRLGSWSMVVLIAVVSPGGCASSQTATGGSTPPDSGLSSPVASAIPATSIAPADPASPTPDPVAASGVTLDVLGPQVVVPADQGGPIQTITITVHNPDPDRWVVVSIDPGITLDGSPAPQPVAAFETRILNPPAGDSTAATGAYTAFFATDALLMADPSIVSVEWYTAPDGPDPSRLQDSTDFGLDANGERGGWKVVTDLETQVGIQVVEYSWLERAPHNLAIQDLGCVTASAKPVSVPFNGPTKAFNAAKADRPSDATQEWWMWGLCADQPWLVPAP